MGDQLTIKYRRLDLTKRNKTIDKLKDDQGRGYLIIGVEVTDVGCANICHINIDPQHTNQDMHNITAVELMYMQISKIKSMLAVFNKVLFVTVKPDIDSISAMVLASYFLRSSTFDIVDNDLMLRLITIANSDRHGSDIPWNKRRKNNYFTKKNHFTKFGLPIGLLAAIGDVRVGIDFKVKVMDSYLIHGTFDDIDKYTAAVVHKNKVNNKSTDIRKIIHNKLTFIESNYRGALGLGYRYSPVVIAMNPTYSFSRSIKGRKYTISQFSKGYLDMPKLLDSLSGVEAGWGGDATTIIGSSQSNPSKLDPEWIITSVRDSLIK